MSVRLCVSSALLAAVLVAAPAAATIITASGTTPRLAAEAGGVRFRALNTSAAQQEVYLGRSDLGVGGNRVAQNLTWLAGANSFSLSYDADADTLTSIVNGGSALSFTNFRGGLGGPVAGLPLNFLQIQLRDGAVGAGSIGLSDLALNGIALTPNSLAAPEAQISYWGFFGDFAQSFTFSGKLNLAGNFGSSAEGNRVEFIIGNAAVPEPASWAMMLGGFGLVGGTLRRRRLAGSAVAA